MALKQKEMEATIIGNLATKTGKDLDGWIAALRTEAPKDRKEALAYLKHEGLGHFQAMIIAKHLFPAR